MRIRTRSICTRRTRSSLRARPLLTLPEEVILLILKFLPAKDLTNLRLACNSLKTLIDCSSSIWRTVSFPGIWPSRRNLHVLERASNTGNIEASIKIGLAHLYNEGITDNKVNSVSNAQQNGKRAAEHFCKAERASVNGDPFIWFFVRPPWAPTGVCCKSCVFKNIVEFCSVSEPNDSLNKSLLYCIGKITSLHIDDNKKEGSMQWLQNAASLGSSHAAYEIWKMKSAERLMEPSLMLQSVRELRDIASSGNIDAQLNLAMQYASGNLGGATKEQIAEFIRQFVSRSKPTSTHKLFSFQTELNSTMRCILVDWLVEVAVMKDFPSQVVHIAVACVDQFIMSRTVQRSELQLLGITCILIAARFQGKDIVTIREAAWLTDNTYKYEDVVRMMGEVMACVRGQVRVLTIPDYLSLYSSLIALDKTTDCLASYIADLSILHTEFGRFSPSILAASCLIPSRDELLSLIVPLCIRLEQQNLKLKTSSDSLLDVSFGCLSESGYDGDLEDEGEQMMDETTDESEFVEKDSMLNRQQGHASFISDEHSRSTSTPSIFRQKAFFNDNEEDMDIEPPIAIGNMIDSANDVYIPVARQPLKEVENNLEQPYTNKIMKPKSRRKECPLRTRRTRGKNSI
ncbi:Cyclin-F [Exaiptasia diaphana]|nr:Cyclin-F [Exaiptasia diaphana]